MPPPISAGLSPKVWRYKIYVTFIEAQRKQLDIEKSL